jgi:hypothetical protein
MPFTAPHQSQKRKNERTVFQGIFLTRFIISQPPNNFKRCPNVKDLLVYAAPNGLPLMILFQRHTKRTSIPVGWDNVKF